VGTISVDPSSVKLRGDQAALAAITSVATQTIDVSGATATFSRDVSIVVPNAAQMAEPTIVTVTVEILPIQGTRAFEGVPVMVSDVRAGLTATANPTGIRLVIRGPKDAIAGLQPGDIKAIVSAADLNPGPYRLKPNVILPAGYSLVEMAPADVAVTITGP
jgi:YbbR domain-containing protein